MTDRATRFEGGTIWTSYEPGADPAFGEWRTTDAVLIAGGRVVAVGEQARVATDVEVVDLEGGLLLPGFADGHVHPLFGGLQSLHAPVHEATTIAQVQRTVEVWSAEHPDDDWIVGYGYDPSLADGGVFDSLWLDAAQSQRPVALWASDFHTMWVNSRALALAGVDAQTPDPLDGVIERRPDGSPIGTLREWGAWGPIADLLPDPGARRVEALDLAARYMASRGITWAQDAWVERETADAWLTAAGTGRLRVRADLAWRFDPGRPVADQVRVARELRDATGDPAVRDHLTARTVKFFADGVIEGGTGALLEPYCECAALHGLRTDGADRGLPVWDAGHLTAAVGAAVAAGFAPHIHAIGDLAIRMALDACEEVDVAGHGLRAVIAHTQVLHPDDLPRFAALGAVANFEPLWACFDPAQARLTAPRLGPERTAQQYLIASVLRSGAPVSFGSDWPVSDVDPLAGIAMAVSRTYPGEEAWLPEERIGFGAAVAAYTAGAAYQAGDEADRGQLLPGMRADLAWLESPAGPVRGTWQSGLRTF